MSDPICHLTIYSKQVADAYSTRSEIRNLLNSYRGCKVVSCERSCIDPACTDIKMRLESRSITVELIATVRRMYAGCDIETVIAA